MADSKPFDLNLLSPETSGKPGTFSGPAVSPQPVGGDPTHFSKTMTTAGTAADTKLGDSTTGAPCATCPFKIRLEHRSRYTQMTKYSKQEWVAAKDFIFLIGQQRVLNVRVAEPAGAVATWEVTPVGAHSGTLKPNTGTGNQFDYTPQVTQAQRPITASRSPNPAVKYRIKATVTANGHTQELTETVEQDERDIIRNEYVDFRTWRERNGVHFTLHVPYRNRIVAASRPELRGNYVLVVDSAMTLLVAATTALYGSQLAITSGWRNPRRNLAAGSTAVNSNHQHGGAVDMAPGDSHTATGSTRRSGFVTLYNDAKQVDSRYVVLEAGAAVLYQGPPLAVTAKQKDVDEDGIADGTSAVGLFNQADHVHIDRSPPNEAEDD
jgi:uncharacterized protein YcbK (DUF882 family)